MATKNKNGTSRCTSVSLDLKVKRRLDALAAIGRRTRNATVDLLLESYLRDNPTLSALVANHLDKFR
jgi:predicted transcriptional regulator